jgi:hypothetical protein
VATHRAIKRRQFEFPKFIGPVLQEEAQRILIRSLLSTSETKGPIDGGRGPGPAGCTGNLRSERGHRRRDDGRGAA